MAQSEVLRPYGMEYDLFLYEYVGKDRNGVLVTVLSTLARLGVDPWKEASELTMLPEEAARKRLCATISSFRDVPSLEQEHGAIVRRLVSLLPPKAPGAGAQATTAKTPFASIVIAFVVATALSLLAQHFLFGPSGF